MAKKVLTYILSEPLCRVTTIKVDIDAGSGNLMIDQITASEPMLANGTLQYVENQGVPKCSLDTSSGQGNNGQAVFTLRASSGSQPWFRLPWAACNSATDWKIHLNPTCSFDILAHTAGGNIRLDLAGLPVTRVVADTGGGNIDIVLPDNAAGLRVAAKAGAGNVTMHMSGGIAARIHATSGLGKVVLDSRFNKIDENTYQSQDYDEGNNTVELTLNSGAGNVSVIEKDVVGTSIGIS